MLMPACSADLARPMPLSRQGLQLTSRMTGSPFSSSRMSTRP